MKTHTVKVTIWLNSKIAKACNPTGFSLTSALLYFALPFYYKLLQDTAMWTLYPKPD